MRIPLVDLSRQHAEIKTEVDEGIARLFESGAFVKGPEVGRFEQEFAEFCGVAHCIGVGNGTDALELAIRALGISNGDRVIVPVNSFIASALAVVRAGAEVVLVDCDPETYLIDVDRVEAALTGEVKAVMPVHLFGQIAPVEEISSLNTDLAIIEDAAQSQGATRRGRSAGSLGTVAGTSFYPGKNIGAYGDAGAVLTDNDHIAAHVTKLGNWGSNEKYRHPEVGFNSRLDSIQAVVLRAKLAKLPGWNEQRAVAAKRYDQLLADDERIVLPVTAEHNVHVWHLYVVRVSERDRILVELHEAGVGAGVHYPVPMHLQGALSDLGHQAGDFPEAEAASREILSLPIFPGITEDEQEFVASRLKSALSGGTR